MTDLESDMLDRLLGVLGVDFEECPSDASDLTKLHKATDAALRYQKTVLAIKRAVREF